jgi:hypothetical protein
MPDSVCSLPARPSLEHLQKQAKDLLRQFRADSPTATLAEAQFVLAREYGFESWAKLKHHVDDLELPKIPTVTDLESFSAALRDPRVTGLNASAIQLTDGDVLQLAAMPQLETLDISGRNGRITDAALAVLRQLPRLRQFRMCWQPNVTDAGLAHLAACEELEAVDVLGTPTGDGVIRALSGKRQLRRLQTGNRVSNEGISRLHAIPAFHQWLGGEFQYELMSTAVFPNQLVLAGSFTDAGLAALAGLDGVFGIAFSKECPHLTNDALRHLRHMANLSVFSYQGERCTDDAMPHLAAIPRLRLLAIEAAVATDKGFRRSAAPRPWSTSGAAIVPISRVVDSRL